jgi:hypothetical protein
MELLNRESQATHCFRAPHPCSTAPKALPHPRMVLQPLLAILGSAILATIGPVALQTVAQVSLVLIQVFLGLCQLGLAAFNIFGR